MERFYKHPERDWDSLTSTVHPGILANPGWIEITEKQSNALEKQKENTPFEIVLKQSGEHLSISCKGADGQQVADTLILALSKIPKKRGENGLTEFILALCSISILFWVAVSSISSPQQNQITKPAQVQLGSK
jgi:hypothetical protein